MKSDTLVSGLKWSFLERASVIGLQLILEVVLARLLMPEDYGILGMIVVVVAFANVFVDSGFSNALIHFQDRNEADYSAVFYLSIAIGIISYILLYFAAPHISAFYARDLTLMIRVIGISILFNSFGVLYRARLIIQINFKKQTLFSAVSMIISGIIGIFLAYSGLGVWALITQLLVYSFLYNFFLFFHYKVLPRLFIEQVALRRILGFGSKIFLSSVIHAVYFNAYPVLLGKVYTSNIVGLYTKANQLSIYPAGMFSAVIQRVFFPFLAAIQSDSKAIFRHNLRFIKLYSLAVFPVVALVIFFAKPLMVFLLSDTWIDVVRPLQILLVASAFFPIIILNMNIFQVLGKSGLFLRTEIITKVIGIVILLLTFRYGFIVVCLGILLQIITQFGITAAISSKLLKQNMWLQIFIVFKILLFTIVLYLIPMLLGLTSILGIAVFAISYLLIIHYFYRQDVNYVFEFIKNKVK